MKKSTMVLMLLTLAACGVNAQNDDMYFVPKKKSVKQATPRYEDDRQPAYYVGSSRDVDEYNRHSRLHSSYQVIEHNDSLIEYERTGIAIDSVISSQLLINIFEHNTPLHDGAVLVRGNRIVAATCYLPLSDNRELSKDLGTRHRAAVGISEVTDSLTVIVSEETGKVSVAMGGELFRNVDAAELKSKLELLQNKVYEEKKILFWKGRARNEKSSDK